MYNNQHQQNHYDYEPQYQYQHQNAYQHDAYAMNDMTHQQYNRQQDYSYYDEHKPSPATTDGYYATPNRSSQVGVSGAPTAVVSEKYARRNNRDKRSCCDLLCCGCCTCCPQWCRWILCIIFLIIVALGITVGVLAALFKTPSVEFTGVQGSPNFGLTGTNVNLNVSLGFTVKNPNIESVTFSTLTATAFYHGDTTELGGGTLHDLHIGSHSVTNIDFPFSISMDVTNSQTQVIAAKMMADCGLGGGTAGNINLDYKVVATVKIIGIPISVPYSSSVGFKCPLGVSIIDQ
ncbi:unnamed protein product [Mucor hiemalis]